MQADRYSRLVLWLKIVFPLMALALLSTLFLLSRDQDPAGAIPFADKEIQDRLRDQQVTGPFFAGTTADGDQITFAADKLITPDGQLGTNQAQQVRARFVLTSGGDVTLQAAEASFDLAEDRADLTGDVIFNSSTGYRMTSDLLTSELSALHIISPGPVHGSGPPGILEAGRMSLTAPETGSAAQLIFTNGVKLIYTPKQPDE